MSPLLEITDLHKVYPNGTHALKNINLTVDEGEFIILLGLSGSGKSTLLRCINRLIEPTQGEIKFDGNDVTGAKGDQLRKIRCNIGMVFQQFNLIKNLSVMTNVLTGRLGHHGIIANWKKSEIETANQNLIRVGMSHYADRLVKNLSGGQQQRVAIARALMQEPKLILADEPVASLDPATADSVMQHLGDLNKKDNITVVCSLHFLSLARKYGTRVVALKDGEIVFQGTPQEIDDERFKAIYGEDAKQVEIR
ncbi:MAG TPA: phosphonate ABC transporter ATP-binding protein [Candidatus Cloacimonadota bacterium]|nr:phosphonate ABC transporter ATP-binding protein [Candidatus Cloacimonadota bacterium]